jgi:hypothetical protein
VYRWVCLAVDGHGPGDLSAGFAFAWPGEAAGDLDHAVVVTGLGGYLERLELVPGVPDDVSGPDLGDGLLPSGWPGGEGRGEMADPFERGSLTISGQGLLAAGNWLACGGGAGGLQRGTDSGTEQVPQFEFRAGCQVRFANGAERGVDGDEPEPGLCSLLYDLPSPGAQSGA